MTRILWSLFAHTSTNTLTHSHAHICFDLHSKQTTHTYHTIEVKCLSLFSHTHTHSLFLVHSLLCFSHTLSCVWHIPPLIVYLSLSFSFYLSLSLSHTRTQAHPHALAFTNTKAEVLVFNSYRRVTTLTSDCGASSCKFQSFRFLLHKLNSLASLLCVT